MLILLASLLAFGEEPAFNKTVEVTSGWCRSGNDCDTRVVIDGKAGPTFSVVDVYWRDNHWNYTSVGGKIVYTGTVSEDLARTSSLKAGNYVVWGEQMLKIAHFTGAINGEIVSCGGQTPCDPKLTIKNTYKYADFDGTLAFLYVDGKYHPKMEGMEVFFVKGGVLYGPVTTNSTSDIITATATCEKPRPELSPCTPTFQMNVDLTGAPTQLADWEPATQ